MKKYINKVLAGFLILILITGCSSSKEEYSADYPKTKAILKEDVRYNIFSGIDTYEDDYIYIDYSDLDKGYIGVKRKQDSDIVLFIKKDNEKYHYDLTDKLVAYPLQMGNGTYEVYGGYFNGEKNGEKKNYQLFMNPLSLDLNLKDEQIVYLYPNEVVSYDKDSSVVDLSFDLTKEDEDDLARLYHLYKYTIETLDYDDEKAKQAESIYVLPNLEEALKNKSGICFDYAALLAALCRIQNIPSKVIVGYTDEGYHAWVEIYLKEKGWINPNVEFSSEDWSLMDPTYASSGFEYEGSYDEVKHY